MFCFLSKDRTKRRNQLPFSAAIPLRDEAPTLPDTHRVFQQQRPERSARLQSLGTASCRGRVAFLRDAFHYTGYFQLLLRSYRMHSLFSHVFYIFPNLVLVKI